MLRQCENDIDLSTETGKIDYLRRTSDIIAEIPSKVERQVYISTVSAKCGISPSIFNDHIDNMLRNKNKIQKKNQWRSIKTETTFHRDTINPDSEKNHKEAVAEESIICYILNSPEDAGKISEMIPPEYFVTSFNKKVYSALLRKIKTSENFDISLMHEEFSPDEFGKITGITVNSMYKDMSTKYIQDCAETLKEYNSTHTQDSEISNEELRSLFKSKK
jgi:DNA primase